MLSAFDFSIAFSASYTFKHGSFDTQRRINIYY